MTGGAISIGRRIGEHSMSAELWRQFVRDVEQVVVRHGGVIHLRAYGVGAWDGLPEEAAVITFEGAVSGDLVPELAWLAALYGQDAIALMCGPARLVKPTVVPQSAPDSIAVGFGSGQ